MGDRVDVEIVELHAHVRKQFSDGRDHYLKVILGQCADGFHAEGLQRVGVMGRCQG